MPEQKPLPDVVYLITVDNEWPITAVAVMIDGPRAAAIEWEHRRRSGNVSRDSQVHVYVASLADIREVKYMPAITTPSVVQA